MKPPITRVLAILAASAGLLVAAPAAAHGNRWDGPRWSGPPYGHAWGHHKHRHDRYERRVIRERIIVERPRDYYHYDAPVRYRYARDPAIVIGVSIPPIVIPIR